MAQGVWQIVGVRERVGSGCDRDGGLGSVLGMAFLDCDDHYPQAQRLLLSPEGEASENASGVEEDVRPSADTGGYFQPRITPMGEPGRLRTALVIGNAGGSAESRTSSAACARSEYNPGLAILQQGFGLEPSSLGRTGLPEGATLFVQPLATTKFTVDYRRRRRRRADGDSSQTSATEETSCAVHDGLSDHVLLFSYRARSQTRVMVLSADGEARPVEESKARHTAIFVPRSPAVDMMIYDGRRGEGCLTLSVRAARFMRCLLLDFPLVPPPAHLLVVYSHFHVFTPTQGFKYDAHTVYLGRSEPDNFLVQVTDQDVTVIDPVALVKVGDWKAPSTLTLQFAAIAGSVVAAISGTTLIVLSVAEPSGLGAASQTKAVTLREHNRVELSGPASSLAMRLVGDLEGGVGEVGFCGFRSMGPWSDTRY